MEIPEEPPIEYLPIWVPPVEHKKISMTIATFNRPKYLQNAVKSVLAQTCQDFHLYIIDNNSLPEVKKVLDQWIGNPKITIYTTTMTEEWRSHYWGCEVCHKFAWTLGDEPYICTMSDDCEMFPDRLEKMSKFLDDNPDVQICFGQQVMFDINGHTRGIRGPTQVVTNGAHYIDGNQVFYRRSLNEEIYPKTKHWVVRKIDGNPDVRFFEELTKRNINMYPVDVQTEKFYFHRFHQEFEKDDALRED